MAILNFSNTYKQITDLGYKINDSTSKDYIKLFFTGDKHIVSHGVDYLADYVNGIRGLVPSTTVTGKQVLLDNGWGNLTIDMLPYNEIMDVSSTTTILSILPDSIASTEVIILVIEAISLLEFISLDKSTLPVV